MRQVVGFLNCLKKNGLSNEKYVPRKRPRSCNCSRLFIASQARRPDVLSESRHTGRGYRRRAAARPAADEREKPNATRPETERSPLCFAFPKQSGAPYDNTGCIGIPGQLRHFLQEASRWSQRPFLFSARAGRAFSAGGHQQIPSSCLPGKRHLVKQGATIFKKEAIR